MLRLIFTLSYRMSECSVYSAKINKNNGNILSWAWRVIITSACKQISIRDTASDLFSANKSSRVICKQQKGIPLRSVLSFLSNVSIRRFLDNLISPAILSSTQLLLVCVHWPGLSWKPFNQSVGVNPFSVVTILVKEAISLVPGGIRRLVLNWLTSTV